MAKKKQELTSEELLEQALVREEDWPYRVPGNWVWVKFGCLAKDMADGPFGSNLKREHYTEKSEVRIIQLSNLGEDGWRNENTKYTTYEHAKTISRSMVKAGEIVIAKMMPAGRAIKVPDLEDAYVLSSDAVKFIPKPMLNIDYLLYGINSTDFRTQISSDTQGITRARTSIGKLKSYAFPLPPLAEQQRIVDRIESLFNKLDQAKDLIQEALDSFATRKAAILHQAFTGQLTKKWRVAHGVGLENWEEIPFGKVVNNYDSKRIPLSRTQRENMQRNYDYYGASGIIDSVDNYLFEERLLLIGEDGANLVTRNKPIAFIADGKYWVNNHAHVVDTKESMDLDFLCYFINSIDLIPYVTGSAQPKITQAKLNTIPIKCPAINEQQEIVRILDDLFEKEQKAKDLIDLIDQIEAMKKTILGQAFRGELETNEAGEESSVALLKTILK